MPEVEVCNYCHKEIDKEKDKYVEISKEQWDQNFRDIKRRIVHVNCYERRHAKPN